MVLLFTLYLKRDEESVFFDFQSELSAHSVGIDMKYRKRACLSEEIAKNTALSASA